MQRSSASYIIFRFRSSPRSQLLMARSLFLLIMIIISTTFFKYNLRIPEYPTIAQDGSCRSIICREAPMLEFQISSMDSSVQLALLMIVAVVFSDLVKAFLKTAWQKVLWIIFWIRYTTSFERKYPQLVCYMDRDILDNIPADKLREMGKKKHQPFRCQRSPTL